MAGGTKVCDTDELITESKNDHLVEEESKQQVVKTDSIQKVSFNRPQTLAIQEADEDQCADKLLDRQEVVKVLSDSNDKKEHSNGSKKMQTLSLVMRSIKRNPIRFSRESAGRKKSEDHLGVVFMGIILIFMGML